MMRRRRNSRYPSTTTAAGSDTDALQTDVMRFMSIIGLCLMAVFALVQGIPLQEPGKPAQPARLRQEIRLQQQQLREQQAELQALVSAMVSAQQVVTTAKKQLETIAGQAQQAREERERLEGKLESLDRQLQQRHLELADLEHDARQKQQDLDELRQRLFTTQTQLTNSRKEIGALQRQLQQLTARPVIEQPLPVAPAAKTAATPIPKSIPEAAPEKQGFTLRFESDAALDRLVTAGRVSLYAMKDKQAWRLSMTTGRPAVMAVSFPRWYHEMSAATVPTHYSHSLVTAATGVDQSAVVWGVQLPATAKQAIAALTRQRQGGALLIQGDGKVILED